MGDGDHLTKRDHLVKGLWKLCRSVQIDACKEKQLCCSDLKADEYLGRGRVAWGVRSLCKRSH